MGALSPVGYLLRDIAMIEKENDSREPALRLDWLSETDDRVGPPGVRRNAPACSYLLLQKL
jgi:hypothetical protein